MIVILWTKCSLTQSRAQISQNDNQNYCKSPAEMRIIEEEGTPMGPMLRAVNAIAKAIKPKYPRVAVDTLAYQYTQAPPKVETSALKSFDGSYFC
jgi:hypothetical protein